MPERESRQTEQEVGEREREREMIRSMVIRLRMCLKLFRWQSYDAGTGPTLPTPMLSERASEREREREREREVIKEQGNTTLCVWVSFAGSDTMHHSPSAQSRGSDIYIYTDKHTQRHSKTGI